MPYIPTKVTNEQLLSRAQLLSKAITFQTHNQNPNMNSSLLELHHYLEQSFPLVHQHLTKTVINQYSLLYEWKGTKRKDAILFCAHLDTVPVVNATQWHQDPFSGAIKDGFIYGRGTLDFKNGVVALLISVEELLKEGHVPQSTILLAFGHDEEIGGQQGAKYISEYLQKNQYQVKAVFDEGTPIVNAKDLLGPVGSQLKEKVALVSIAEKGFVNMKIKITSSNGGHASLPSLNGSLIVHASNIIQKLHQSKIGSTFSQSPAAEMFYNLLPKIKSLPLRFALWFMVNMLNHLPESLFTSLVHSGLLPPKLLPFFTTTQAVTVIHSGEFGAMNVLPSSVEIGLNFRILTGHSVEQIRQHISRVLEKETKKSGLEWSLDMVNGNNPSPRSPFDTEHYQLLTQILRHQYAEQGVIVLPTLMIAGTDTKHYLNLTRHVYRWTPMEMTSQDLESIHGVNERISINRFADYSDFYKTFIGNQ